MKKLIFVSIIGFIIWFVFVPVLELISYVSIYIENSSSENESLSLCFAEVVEKISSDKNFAKYALIKIDDNDSVSTDEELDKYKSCKEMSIILNLNGYIYFMDADSPVSKWKGQKNFEVGRASINIPGSKYGSTREEFFLQTKEEQNKRTLSLMNEIYDALP